MILIAYIKLVEEKELEFRFGKEYVDYKNDTPFIIPIRIAWVKKQ
jgi:protein-S-isoprenylcysteine O-methyltransferase Ste14